jgi:hypothetical protein
LGADKLNGDHEWRRQKNRPQQAITEVGSGLRIGCDTGRIVIGGPRDKPGPSSRNKIFARLGGGFLSSVMEEFMGMQFK